MKSYGMQIYSIGQLARELEINAYTIRYYEQLGLMDEPFRAGNGYRNYSLTSKKRLQFIKWAKSSGFTLSEIKDLLYIKYTSVDACETVKVKAQIKIDFINKNISELKKFKKLLEKIVSTCKETPGNNCPILENFE